MERIVLPGSVLAPPAEGAGVTNQLIARFKDLIFQKILVPGAKLPPERELARRFGVSRSSLRHALKVLDALGVLRQRIGDGTYLSKTAEGMLSKPLEFLVLLEGISLFEVLETRLIVEPELAARAAERATLADLARLEHSLEGMEKESDQDRLIELDAQFHRAIFRSAGNRLCDHIFSLIHRAMLSSIALTSQLVDWDHTLAYHRRIHAAIDRRRPGEARERMSEHLADARHLLERIAAQSSAVWLPEAIRPLPRRTKRGK